MIVYKDLILLGLRNMAQRKYTDFFSMSWGAFFIFLGTLIAALFAISSLLEHNYFSFEKIAAPFFDYQFYNNVLLYSHILIALPPLVIGPFLFHEQLRNNNLWWHRQFGKIYVICCMTSGTLGAILASAFSVPGAKLGFCTLGALWFSTSYIAYRKARARKFVEHRRWMLRSYSLTFAFFTVRFWAYGMMVWFPDLDLKTQMALRSWLAWVPNFLFIHLYIAATTHRGKFIGWKELKKKFIPARPA
jgi:hypothetical protein